MTNVQKVTGRRKFLADRKGQMAIVMILLVAIGLLFFGVTLNWAKLSSMKTLATVGSNVGAAKLASDLASYGENPVQTSLQGERKKCSWSPTFAKLLLVIIIVAMVIASVLCAGACTGMWVVLNNLTMVLLSAVAATAALVLSAVVIEPGINSMWNKLQMNIPRIEDQFAESALQTALERVVSDQVKVNDISDYDMNGKYCATKDPTESCQKISRFSYHYTRRLLGIATPSTALLEKYRDFRNKLGAYVSDQLGVVKKATNADGTYQWQIDDTCCLTNNQALAAGDTTGYPNPPGRTEVLEQYCDSCCITKPLREPLCGVGGTSIADSTTIDDLLNNTGASAPEPPTSCLNGVYDPEYPLSYDPMFCIRFNYFHKYGVPGKGYAAVMGIDDSLASITRKPDVKTNWPDLRPADGDLESDTKFRGKDSEGLFFPFLWFMKETRTKIKDLTYADADGTAPSQLEACHWCKPTEPCVDAAVNDDLYQRSDPLGYNLSIYNPGSPNDPAPTAPTDNLKCVNRLEGFVNALDNGCRTSPLASCGTEEFSMQLDNVRPFYDYVGQAIKDIVYKCPGDVPDAQWENKGLWRTGNDRFCSSSEEAPYFSGTFAGLCTKFDTTTYTQCFGETGAPVVDENEPEIHNYSNGGYTYDPSVCSCSAQSTDTAKQAWRDDEFDLTIQMMSDLANDTRFVLMDKDERFYKEVDQWGQKAKRWIANIEYVTNNLTGFTAAINSWANGGSYADIPGEESVWCVPKGADVNGGLEDIFKGVSYEERSVIGVPGAPFSQFGTLPSVLACLVYNQGNQAYFDSLSAPYENVMTLKRDYMECAYPQQPEGYGVYCPSGAGACGCTPTYNGITTPGCCPVACVPNYPPVNPVLINNHCGVSCLKLGDVIKNLPPYSPPCTMCQLECPRPANWGTWQCRGAGDPLGVFRPANTCPPGPCGGTCPQTCSGGPATCPAFAGCGGTCPMTCNIAGKCGAPCGSCVGPTCTGMCGYWTCTGVCGYWTCPNSCQFYQPMNICANLTTACNEIPNYCPTHCEGAEGALAGNWVPSAYWGYVGSKCSYTTDCLDSATWQPTTAWNNIKKQKEINFYTWRHGTGTYPDPFNPNYGAPASSLMGMIERNWHRTLSTKSLYDNVPPVTYDFYPGWSTTEIKIRGWDTEDLAGYLGDDCKDFYNYCRPDPAKLGDLTCAQQAEMCVVDKVFVDDFLPDSSLLAARQNIKITKRWEYLNDLRGSALGLTSALPAAGPGSPILQAVADAKAALDALIAQNELEKAKPPDLPNWVTYVWQSPVPEAEKKAGGTEGYWHAVKVEALLPRRCAVYDNAGNGVTDYDGFDCCSGRKVGNDWVDGENKNRFPWIRAYSTHWRTRRCFEMWDEAGCVKVRVSRFDEDHTFQGSVIKFLNGLPLWKFLYRHPIHASEAVDLSNLKDCAAAGGAEKVGAGAFITYPNGYNEATCEAAAERLIQQGYISETCARYELNPDPAKEGKWTYDLMFRECRHCCLQKPRYHDFKDD